MLRYLACGWLAAALSCGGEGELASSSGAAGSGASGGQTSSAQGPAGGHGGDAGAGGTISANGGNAGEGGQAPGGSGGAVGGSGGAGGSGGTGGGGSNGELGDPCVWGTDGCISGLYCQASGCGAGTCQPPLNLAAQTQIYDPVCGCDGVHYFNATIAESRSMAISHAGVCTANEEVACDKVATPCAGGLSCSIAVADAASCAPLTAGVCWGAPITCGTGQPLARGCVAMGDCANKCALIRSQNAWHEDASCQ